MFKRILPIVFILLILGACKKEEGSEGSSVKIGPAPASFTQKVVIEKFTGEWCVHCPEGAEVLSEVMDAHPSQVIGVEIHQNDWLEISQFSVLDQHLGGIDGYPRAALNRTHATKTENPFQDGQLVISRGNWPDFTNRLLQEKAEVGLALETKFVGSKLDVKVFAASQAVIDKETRLTVYVLEDAIQSRKQTGADSTYIHYHVLRKVLSEGLGDIVALNEAGAEIIKEYKGIDVTGLNTSKLKVVAFVSIMPTSSDNTRKILNGQEVKAGKNKNWE